MLLSEDVQTRAEVATNVQSLKALISDDLSAYTIAVPVSFKLQENVSTVGLYRPTLPALEQSQRKTNLAGGLSTALCQVTTEGTVLHQYPPDVAAGCRVQESAEVQFPLIS